MFSNYSSPESPEEIHRKLKDHLINGCFLENDRTSKNYVKWSIYFESYREEPNYTRGSVWDDFTYLESTGQLRVGQYDILKEIFQRIDVRAVEKITKEAEKIERIMSSNGNEDTPRQDGHQRNNPPPRQEQHARGRRYPPPSQEQHPRGDTYNVFNGQVNYFLKLSILFLFLCLSVSFFLSLSFFL